MLIPKSIPTPLTIRTARGGKRMAKMYAKILDESIVSVVLVCLRYYKRERRNGREKEGMETRKKQGKSNPK